MRTRDREASSEKATLAKNRKSRHAETHWRKNVLACPSDVDGFSLIIEIRFIEKSRNQGEVIGNSVNYERMMTGFLFKLNTTDV